MSEITIRPSSLPAVDYHGQRVVTLSMIDQVHQRPVGTAKRNFHKNRKHFIPGVDFFQVCANEIRSHKAGQLGTNFVPSSFGKNASQGIFLTETGYLMIAKSLNDDLAWKVQRELVNGYFSLRTSLAEARNKLAQRDRAYFERYPRDKDILYHITHGEPYWFAAQRVGCHPSTVSAAVKRMLKWAVLDHARLASGRIGSRAVSAYRRKYRSQLRLPF